MSGKNPTKITIRDLARECGLSVSAVSKALNTDPSKRTVSEQTRQRVLEMAHKIGYQPNWQAQSLSSARSATVGMLFFADTPLVMGINETIVAELSHLFRSVNYHTLFLTIEEDESAYASLIRSGRADGYILFTKAPKEFIQLANESGHPLTVINEAAKTGKALNITFNDEDGGYKAMRYLISLGHRNIAFYSDHIESPTQHSSYTLRIEGARRAIKETGKGYTLLEFIGMNVSQMCERIPGLENKPTAVLFHNHYRAVEGQRKLWEMGINCPDQISLMTFNNNYPVDMLTPAMSAVDLPLATAAKIAFENLMGAFNNGSKCLDNTIILDEELIIRESTVAP